MTTKIYIFIIIAIFIVEIWGMTRYYYIWPHLRFSIESLVLTAYYGFSTIMIIKGIYMAKDSDPGYLIPKKHDLNISEKESSPCLKCGFRRTHSRINHCSRCNRCVEYMDHHCVFTDNCVSRKNLRYFFHFIGWAFQALFLGFVIMNINIVTRNHNH